MDWTAHPSAIAFELIKRYGDNLLFEFSVYRYVPLSTTDSRTIFTMAGRDLNVANLEAKFGSLAIGEDLSFHSRVRNADGICHHVPMIDFAGELTLPKLDVISKLLPLEMAHNLVIFRSGKSYHGYVPTLINEVYWREFCGLLLLMNYPNQDPITDSRWIGHRLRGGYGALRWSCNSNGYSIYPRRVGTLNELRTTLVHASAQ